jgi:hypothetical protein
MRRITGQKMQFSAPASLRVRSGYDVDYGMNFVCAGRHCSSHGFGGLWSSGSPPRDFLANVAEMKQREVYDRWSGVIRGIEYNGEEYRGRRTDGTYFRFVGVINETVQYDKLTREAAEILDRVIDSLCWRDSG